MLTCSIGSPVLCSTHAQTKSIKLPKLLSDSLTIPPHYSQFISVSSNRCICSKHLGSHSLGVSISLTLALRGNGRRSTGGPLLAQALNHRVIIASNAGHVFSVLIICHFGFLFAFACQESRLSL